MPDFCAVESLHFLVKMNRKQAFRRKTSTYLSVNVNGSEVKTWYYSPKRIKQFLLSLPDPINFKAVGFLPSYLETAVNRHPLLGKLAMSMDALFYAFNWSSAADHYLLEVRF